MPDSKRISEGEILRAVLAGAPVRVAVLDRAGRFLLDPDPNPPISTDVGTPPGASFIEMYGDTPGVQEAIRAAFAGEPTHLTRQQGGAIYTGTFLPRRGADGSIDSIFAVATVLNTQGFLERALSEVQARERQIFNSNMTALFYWQESGAVTDANDAFLALTGYTREDLTLGRIDWQAITPPEYRDADRAALAEIRARGACTPFEKEYVGKDGRRVSVLIGASSWDAQRGAGIAFVVDVSERKRQERERQEAELALRRVVDAAPIALWAIDATGVFTLCKGRGLRGWGLVPDETVGCSIFKVCSEIPEVLAAVQRALAGEEFSQSFELLGASFDTLFTPLRDSNCAITGVLGVTTDVSERRRAEAERERLQAQLVQAQKLESLGLLAGGIAHDFNNLLSAILGGATVARLMISAQDPVHADIENVISAANRAAGLTRQMLAYAGKGAVEVGPVDLSALAGEIVDLLKTAISKKVEIRLDLKKGLPAIEADSTQIQQVVMNLLINAAEAIEDREGTVVLSTGVERIDAPTSEGLDTGEFVFLQVKDTGHGMSEETQRQIFDPFFTTKFAGRGLGLAATLGIVRAHHGMIRVHSQVGEGACFRALFPRGAGVAASGLQSGSDETYRGEGVVLLIDDERSVRRTTRRMLELFGFSVVEAENGGIGVDAFAVHASVVALVLLDMTMPKMNGEETLRALREVRPDVPVLLMSGYTRTDQAPLAGAAGFIAKPFSMSRLASAIAAALKHTAE
jgi:PAS domain S-box-containing protein